MSHFTTEETQAQGVTVLSKVTPFAVVHIRVVLGGAECISSFDLCIYP